MTNKNVSRSYSAHKSTKDLSDSELEILAEIKQGLTSTEIAAKRNCSSRTVEKHRSNIIKKLNLPATQNALLVYLLNNPKV